MKPRWVLRQAAHSGTGGEGFLRMCYLRDTAILSEALERLSDWLATSKPA